MSEALGPLPQVEFPLPADPGAVLRDPQVLDWYVSRLVDLSVWEGAARVRALTVDGNPNASAEDLREFLLVLVHAGQADRALAALPAYTDAAADDPDKGLVTSSVTALARPGPGTYRDFITESARRPGPLALGLVTKVAPVNGDLDRADQAARRLLAAGHRQTDTHVTVAVAAGGSGRHHEAVIATEAAQATRYDCLPDAAAVVTAGVERAAGADPAVRYAALGYRTTRRPAYRTELDRLVPVRPRVHTAAVVAGVLTAVPLIFVNMLVAWLFGSLVTVGTEYAFRDRSPGAPGPGASWAAFEARYRVRETDGRRQYSLARVLAFVLSFCLGVAAAATVTAALTSVPGLVVVGGGLEAVTFLVVWAGVTTGLYVALKRWGRRRTRTAADRLAALKGGPCDCWKTDGIAGDTAVTYARDHLHELAGAPEAGLFLLRCSDTGKLWMTTPADKVLLAADVPDRLLVAPQEAPSPSGPDGRTGFYL